MRLFESMRQEQQCQWLVHLAMQLLYQLYVSFVQVRQSYEVKFPPIIWIKEQLKQFHNETEKCGSSVPKIDDLANLLCWLLAKEEIERLLHLFCQIKNSCILIIGKISIDELWFWRIEHEVTDHGAPQWRQAWRDLPTKAWPPISWATYLTHHVKMSTSSAAKSVSAWTGVTAMLPLVSAILADSYWDRDSTITASSLLYADAVVICW